MNTNKVYKCPVCVCVCAYLDEVVGAEVEELQQLKVAACRQDILDHGRLQRDLRRGHSQGLSTSFHLYSATASCSPWHNSITANEIMCNTQRTPRAWLSMFPLVLRSGYRELHQLMKR